MSTSHQIPSGADTNRGPEQNDLILVGFRVQGSGFRVQGSGFRVQGSGRGGALVHEERHGRPRLVACSSVDGQMIVAGRMVKPYRQGS